MENPYLRLSEELNRGRLRATLSSGQAVVLYRLAVMSKDGDWILREDRETLDHVLGVLSEHRARYRFGAPLDLRWLSHGWSSHFEFRSDELRLRTDFVTRPPRLPPEEIERLWSHPVVRGVPVVALEQLAAIKRTNREKDYPVIGELARKMRDPGSQFLHSRSSRDLQRLAAENPQIWPGLVGRRPLLARILDGREAIERALDEERRALMRANETRLARFRAAAQDWASIWPRVQREIAPLRLLEAHRVVAARALDVLPFEPPREDH